MAETIIIFISSSCVGTAKKTVCSIDGATAITGFSSP